MTISRRAIFGAAALGAVGALTSGPSASAREGGLPSSLVDNLVVNPSLSQWVRTHYVDYGNRAWTEEAQGLTTDGWYWYVSSNNSSRRRLYKFGPRFPFGDGTIYGYADLPAGAGAHLGPPVFDPFKGLIVASVEPSNIWVVYPPTMATVSLGPLGGSGYKPQGSSIPWAAYSPADGLLYSSAFGRDDQPIKQVDRIHVYDPRNGFRWLRSVFLSSWVYEVQGGCISDNGHLYLTSNRTKDIRAYDLSNGAYLGRCADAGGGDEIEGLTLGRVSFGANDETYVATLVLDNDWWNEDDVRINFYRVPNPATL